MTDDKSIIHLDDVRQEPDPADIAEIEALFAETRPPDPGDAFFESMTQNVMAQLPTQTTPQSESISNDAPPSNVIDLASERSRRRPVYIIAAIAAALSLVALAFWFWPKGEDNASKLDPTHEETHAGNDDNKNKTILPKEEIVPQDDERIEPDDVEQIASNDDEDWRGLETAEQLAVFDAELDSELDSKLLAVNDAAPEALAGDELYALDLDELEELSLVLDEEL